MADNDIFQDLVEAPMAEQSQEPAENTPAEAPAEEAPQSEQPTEEAQTASDQQTQESEATESSQDEADSTEAFDWKFFGDDVDSPDAVKARIEHYQTEAEQARQAAEQAFANEWVKNLNDYIRKSGPNADPTTIARHYMDVLGRDFNEMDSGDLVKYRLQQENPDFDEEIIDALYEDEFGLREAPHEDDFEDQAAYAKAKADVERFNKVKKAKLAQRAKADRNHFLKIQEETKIPQYKQQQEQTQRQQQEQRIQFEKQISKQQFEVKAPGFTFKLEGQHRAAIVEALKNIPGAENWKPEQIANAAEIAALSNPDVKEAIFKSYAKQEISKELEKEAKLLGQAPSRDSSTTGPPANDEAYVQSLDSILGGR